MKPANEKYTVAVDFDGVIHSYLSPWVNAHTIPDGPVDGSIGWLYQMLHKFDVVIFSRRCKTWRGRRAIRKWLRFHAGNCYYESPSGPGIEDIRLSFEKPPALVYIDDRAMRFEGTFPTAQEIHKAKPWNKVASILALCLLLPGCSLSTAIDQTIHAGEEKSREKPLGQHEIHRN
jgi:hypothetical protein